ADGPEPRHGAGFSAWLESKESMTQPYPDPWSTPAQAPQDSAPYQGIPQAPPVPGGYGYGMQPMGAPYGMYFEEKSGLMLPQGVVLASVGRRIGAYFLMILLMFVTLGIGWAIWGLVSWSTGRGPAMQVLGLRCWKPADGKVANWGIMALRNVVGYLAQGLLWVVTAIVSFGLFLGT